MRGMILRGLVLMVIGAAAFVAAVSARAQDGGADKKPAEAKVAAEKKATSVYRVDYTIRETESGKVLNSRKYMLMEEDGNWARTRVGSRVRYQTGEQGFQLENVGMSIDSRVREIGEELLLDTKIEARGMAKAEPSSPGASITDPVLRTLNSEVTATVTLGKPTLVGSMDDVASNRRYEIEATVTKVK